MADKFSHNIYKTWIMSDRNDYQYRAVTKTESSAENGLSVRFIRDFEKNINNYRAKVGCHKLISDMYPSDSPMTSFRISTDALGTGNSPEATDEHVKMIYAPRYVPAIYNHMLVQCNGMRTGGTGSTIWRLRAVSKLYGSGKAAWYGGSGFDPDDDYSDDNSISDCEFFTSNFDSIETCQWTINQDYNMVFDETFSCTIRDNTSRVWFILTSQNSDDTTFSALWNLDVTPIVEDIDS